VLAARLDSVESALGDRAARLAEARAQWAGLGQDAATSLEGSSARLELGLLSGDADEAIMGWRDYFWLSRTDAPPQLAALDASGRFRRGLAASATDQDRLALLDLLIRAGFAQPARRFAAATGVAARAGADPTWRRVAAYFEQRRHLEETALQINRALARGRDTGSTLRDAVMASLRELMGAAGATGDPRSALLEHYGLLGTVGTTSGFPSFHVGHVIEDRRERISQYGHEADVRFVVLDNMIGNGFESWLWDGTAGSGGWTEGGPTIIHVRPLYTDSPVRAAALLADTPQRRQLISHQTEHAASDLAALRRGQTVALPSLSDRLNLQLVDRIEAAARSRVGAGDLRRAFLEEYWRASIQQSIMVHEGRHAIDRVMSSDPESLDQLGLEFRAKLSELALSDYPRMALIELNASTIGGTTPHGRANAMVFEAFRRWIEAHPGEVIGFDPTLPTLFQLDKLTDEQIRAVARSEDPLASTR